MELELLQRELRGRFTLEKETYANWEKDRCFPAMKHWPGIIEFLGYDPIAEPKTAGERLLAYRRQHGLSRKALAASLRVDKHTVWRWEAGQSEPTSETHRTAFANLIEHAQ